MRHVLVRRPGGFGRLELVNEPDPVPGDGEVGVEAVAMGVNFADCLVRMGLYASARRYVGWPITPGFEVSGRIFALGRGVTDFSVGDRVMAVTRFGGYATHLCVPRALVRRLPDALDELQGAAFQVAHLTAWYALTQCASIHPNAKVLIHSAAGGVGMAMVQQAKARGAQVLGVVGRPRKVQTVLDLGADQALHRQSGGLWEKARQFAPAGFDLILDANGPGTLEHGYRALRVGGRLVTYGAHGLLSYGSSGRPNWWRLILNLTRMPRFSPLSLVENNRGVVGFNLSHLFERVDLLQTATDELISLLESGRLARPQVQPFAFDAVADAHRAIESGETTGKLVLVV